MVDTCRGSIQRPVTYFNSSDNPSAQTRTVSFQAVDDGGAASSVSTATVSVTPVNDAPVVTGLAGTVGFTENGSAVGLSLGVVATDVDSTLFTGAKIAIDRLLPRFDRSFREQGIL